MKIKNAPQNVRKRKILYAEVFASTGNATYAMERAGYRPASSTRYDLARDPLVLEEIAKHQASRIVNDALPVAIDCLIEIMSNRQAPAGARVSAAKVVIDRALGNGEDGASREPHEMTADEIARAISQLEETAAARAKPVTASESDQALDVFA